MHTSVSIVNFGISTNFHQYRFPDNVHDRVHVRCEQIMTGMFFIMNNILFSGGKIFFISDI